MTTSPLLSQPLSGEFTVGGPSPSFATLQAAANAVKARGVSGPVWFNIRPGIYMENGGLNSVMTLDSIIAGSSSTNRITFQPDQNFGGDVGNTKLQIDQTVQSSGTPVVRVTADHVTIRNLTLEDVDTTGVGANFLLSIDASASNPTTEDIIIEGCRFIGNPHPTGGAWYGTFYGVHGTSLVSNIVIRQNTFQRLLCSVGIGGQWGTWGSVIVEDNQVLNAHNQPDNTWTAMITVRAATAIVRRNNLDNAGGLGSLYGIIVSADSGLIERNTIKNGGGASAQVPTFRAISIDNMSGNNARSMLVVNNMISGSASVGGWGGPIMGRYGIITETKAAIVHNTIVHPPRQQIGGGIVLGAGSDSSTVLNNIIVDYGIPLGILVRSIVLFDQASTTSGLISDYNVFFYNQPGVYLVARGSTLYTSLSEYQVATGLDSNSISKEVEFAFGDLYPHLSDCQAQDPQLNGIPYPGIVDDIDSDVRSLTAPTRGADEGRLRATKMFGDVFRDRILSGWAEFYYHSVAAGKFDNLLVDGLAVTDYAGKQIRLYHNLPSARSFSLLGALSLFDLGPWAVSFFDLDDDGNLDLIAGGDTALVKVFWGDGAGGFPQVTTIPTRRWIRSIDVGRLNFYNRQTVVFTEASGLGPQTSFLCYLNGSGRNLEHGTAIRSAPGGGTEPDTLYDVLTDMVVGDLDGNGSHEVAAPALSWPPKLYVFADTSFGNTTWGHHNIYPLPTLATSNSSSIVMGRFSGGSLNDLITPSVSIPQHTCILLRNQGGLSFAPDTIRSGAFPHALASMDYDNDGDLDFVAANFDLASQGVSVFLNDGTGHFTEELNCYSNFGSGRPSSAVASDFDLDGKTDLAIVTWDSLFVLYNNFGNVTGIGNEPLLLMPTTFSLEQNYPNPFNPTTTLRFNVPTSSQVTIKIYDMLGREVKTLLDRKFEAGSRTMVWDGKNNQQSSVASGVYFVRMQAEGFMAVKKIVLLR